MEIQIRQAVEADATGAINTLRLSILELCALDHQNDPGKVEDWLRNKTVEAWKTWIARDDAIVLVAQRHSEVVGVGMATLSGAILLNYVHPKARFSGISKAIITNIEAVLRTRGVKSCQLESTKTARSFYEKCGFLPDPSDSLLLSKAI